MHTKSNTYNYDLIGDGHNIVIDIFNTRDNVKKKKGIRQRPGHAWIMHTEPLSCPRQIIIHNIQDYF